MRRGARTRFHPAVLWAIPVLALSMASMAWLDRPLAVLLQTPEGPIRASWDIITELGAAHWSLIPLALAALHFHFLRPSPYPCSAAWFSFLSIAASGVTVDILKILLRRRRPALYLREGLHGFITEWPRSLFDFPWEHLSFPSGHTATITSLWISLGFFYPSTRYPLAALALAVAASRMALGAHYLSDVAAGAYIGIVAPVMLRAMLERKGISLPPGGTGRGEGRFTIAN